MGRTAIPQAKKEEVMNDHESKLSDRINLPEIKEIAAWAHESEKHRFRLWELAHSDDRRTSVNALWVMSHLSSAEAEWLSSLQNELIDMLLSATDPAKKRILLQLLWEQDFEKESERTDLIDFCLSKINSECEPYAIRAFSIYVSFKLCRHYPELLNELREHLSMMQYQQLSPGLRCARKKVLTQIDRIARSQGKYSKGD